jgi:hypothetical protein
MSVKLSFVNQTSLAKISQFVCSCNSVSLPQIGAHLYNPQQATFAVTAQRTAFLFESYSRRPETRDTALIILRSRTAECAEKK